MNVTKTPEYRSWKGMKARCYNPNDPYFSRYGARGIVVCPRWRDSFPAFLEDMGERPPGFSIDRINLDGDYELGNCRWAGIKEQNRNRSDTFWVTIGSERKSLAEWCDIKGVSYRLVRKRIREMGWSPAQAMAMPNLGVGRRRTSPQWKALAA